MFEHKKWFILSPALPIANSVVDPCTPATVIVAIAAPAVAVEDPSIGSRALDGESLY